jgi:hypothetical protein
MGLSIRVSVTAGTALLRVRLLPVIVRILVLESVARSVVEDGR